MITQFIDFANSVWNLTDVKVMVVLVLLDFLFGILHSLRDGTFQADRLTEFITGGEFNPGGLLKVATYGILRVFTNAIPSTDPTGVILIALTGTAGVTVVWAYLASIIEGLEQTGIPIPQFIHDLVDSIKNALASDEGKKRIEARDAGTPITVTPVVGTQVTGTILDTSYARDEIQ